VLSAAFAGDHDARRRSTPNKAVQGATIAMDRRRLCMYEKEGDYVCKEIM
jgi:hypothetical protein